MQDAVPKPLGCDALQQLVSRWCGREAREDFQQDLFKADGPVATTPLRAGSALYEEHKATLAALLAKAADARARYAPGCGTIALAMKRVAALAERHGEEEICAVAAGLAPVFEAAQSFGDSTRLARHAISQLEPLGFDFD